MCSFSSDPARQGDGLSQGWGVRTRSVQGCCMAGLTLSRYITSKTTQVKPQWKIRLIWGRNSKIIFCMSSYLGTNLTWPIFLSVRVWTHVCMCECFLFIIRVYSWMCREGEGVWMLSCTRQSLFLFHKGSGVRIEVNTASPAEPTSPRFQLTFWDKNSH